MELKKVLEQTLKDSFVKIILSNPTKKSNHYQRVVFMGKQVKGKMIVQIEKFTDKQVFHENIDMENVLDRILELMIDFKQLNYFGNEKETEIKISKKGQIFVSSHEVKHSIRINLEHNRKKNYILQEGMVIAPLVDLGIFTKDGKIVHAMYDKYKQINRFLELVEDVIKNYAYEEINILDFGCGKSYLTFILYYYLVEIKKIKATIIGLDLKKDVIENCNKIAEKYGYRGMHFEIGDIQNFKYTDKVDMVITLHACDTATDFALFNAMKWNARFILSVPCCQHELNAQIKTEDYEILTRYGLIKERISALFTDAIRANCLTIAGYKTQVIEFIDMAHSPKNILLRAVKQNISDSKKQDAKKEIDQLCNQFSLKPTLVELMKKQEFNKKEGNIG